MCPPGDPLTYNGSIWALARETYFRDPGTAADTSSLEYRAAVEFYRRRAVGPNFQWSWRNAELEQDIFRQTIQNGDEAFRRAQQQLGLLLANHLLSAIDAYVSRRLGRAPRPSHRIWIGDRRDVTSVHFLLTFDF